MSTQMQKRKNRYRLMFLLVFYPIYKTINFILAKDYIWAIPFLMISIIYSLSIIVIIKKTEN